VILLIVCDTGFLSSFLKIDRLDLLFTAFKTDSTFITDGVLRELKKAPVHSSFVEALRSSNNRIIVKSVVSVASDMFGCGELESIALAEKEDALLLIDDRKAAQFAKDKGVRVVSIPAFLLYCKVNSILSVGDLKRIIGDLKDRDYYEFSDDVKNKLLE
jgi:predicted nucleic acid-binding protein